MAETLYEQALHAHQSGRSGGALELLDIALAQAPTPIPRARIQHLRGLIEIWAQPPMRTHELLLTEAAAIEVLDPRLAASMLATAAQAAVMAGETQIATDISAHALSLAIDDQPTPPAVQALDLLLAPAEFEREDTIRKTLAEIASRGKAAAEPIEALHSSAAVLYWLEDYPRAERVLQYVIDEARPRRHPILPVALDTLAALSFRTGRWALTDARSTEALRLAREYRQSWVVASCLTTLARLGAARGREHETRTYLREARETATAGDLASAYAASSAALLELGLGHAEQAISELEPLLNDDQLPWTPLIVQWTPDLIEAYVRARRPDDAAETLQSFQQRAHESRRTWAIASAARCSGLLAPTDEFEHHFLEALRYHALTPTPFERARTELCFGERLRRTRRHREAATMLRSALGTFERLNATPWAERARRELTNKRTPRSEGGTLTQLLTPHELQVAALIERGATNRQAATTLFLTPKTIDYHLNNIYKKLNIHTRTELAYRLSQDRTRQH